MKRLLIHPILKILMDEHPEFKAKELSKTHGFVNNGKFRSPIAPVNAAVGE